MGTITRIPAIRTAAATWVELMPNTTFLATPIFESEFVVNEFANITGGAAGLTEVFAQAYGQEITVSGSYVPPIGTKPTMSLALAYRATLNGYLLASTGKPNVVDLCEYADSAKVKKGIWRSCVLAGPIQWRIDRTIKRVSYEFRMRSPYYDLFASGGDATNSIPNTASATYKAYHASYVEP